MEVAETNAAESFQDLQALQIDIDVEDWLEDAVVSETTDEDLTDEQIIAMVKNSAPANEEDDKHEDKNIISDDPVTHSAAKDACEVLLKYIEHHPTAV